MGERGAGSTYRASYTRLNKATGKRELRFTKTWTWEYKWRKRTYRPHDGHGWKTRGEARAAMEAHKRVIGAGHGEDPHRLTMVRLRDALLAEYAVSLPASLRLGEYAFKHLLRYFPPDLAVTSIDAAELNRYVVHRRGQKAMDSTIKKELAYLHRGMTLARDSSPGLTIPRFPKLKRNVRRGFFRDDQFELVMQHIAAHYVPYYRAAKETGWRARSELKTRQWTHVDFVNGWLRLEPDESKTDEARTFPLTATLRGILEDQREYVSRVERETESIIPWVFIRPDGQPLGNERKAWQSALKRCGIGKAEGRTGPWSSALVPHDLRRTAVMRNALAGIPRPTSMALTGHRTASIHDDYNPPDVAGLNHGRDLIDTFAGVQSNVVPFKTGTGGTEKG